MSWIRIFIRYTFLILCLSYVGCAASSADKKTIDVKDIQRMNTQVIGSSGLPFGTIFHAQGAIIKNDRSGKNKLWTERLRITHINGSMLDEPYLINVDSRYQGIELEVSENIQLIGFEEGYFTGQPVGFANYTNWIPGDIGFCFIEIFTVIREAETGDLLE